MPHTDWRLGQPVGAVPPVAAIRSPIKRDQGVSVPGLGSRKYQRDRGAVWQIKPVEVLFHDIFPYSRQASAQLVPAEAEARQCGKVAQLGRNCPAQLVPPEAEVRQCGKVAQFRWNRAIQLIPAEVKVRQCGEVAQFWWNPPAQLVAAEAEARQRGEVAQFQWNLPAQIIVPETNFNDASAFIRSDTMPGADRRVGKPVVVVGPFIAIRSPIKRYQGISVRGSGVSRRGRGAVWQTKLVEIVVFDIFPYRKLASCQPVTGEVQCIQITEVAQFWWNGPAQLVVAEAEDRQRGKVAQFRWNCPPQIIAAEAEARQCGKVAQFRWNRPPQIVVPEVEFNNATTLIRSDTIPGADWRVGKPVFVGGPFIAIRSPIKRNQDVSVLGGGSGKYRRCRGAVWQIKPLEVVFHDIFPCNRQASSQPVAGEV